MKCFKLPDGRPSLGTFFFLDGRSVDMALMTCICGDSQKSVPIETNYVCKHLNKTHNLKIRCSIFVQAFGYYFQFQIEHNFITITITLCKTCLNVSSVLIKGRFLTRHLPVV